MAHQIFTFPFHRVEGLLENSHQAKGSISWDLAAPIK